MSLSLARGERADGAVLDRRGDRLDRVEVAVRAGREAGFDHVDLHPLELLRDADLLFLRHRRAGRLLAVTQGRVENDQFVCHVRSPVGRLLSKFGVAMRKKYGKRNSGVCATAGDAEQQTRQTGGENDQRGRRASASAHRGAPARRERRGKVKIDMSPTIAAFPRSRNRPRGARTTRPAPGQYPFRNRHGARRSHV